MRHSAHSISLNRTGPSRRWGPPIAFEDFKQNDIGSLQAPSSLRDSGLLGLIRTPNIETPIQVEIKDLLEQLDTLG